MPLHACNLRAHILEISKLVQDNFLSFALLLNAVPKVDHFTHDAQTTLIQHMLLLHWRHGNYGEENGVQRTATMKSVSVSLQMQTSTTMFKRAWIM